MSSDSDDDLPISELIKKRKLGKIICFLNSMNIGSSFIDKIKNSCFSIS